MFNVAMCLMDIFLAWRWGDWRNWTKYQSTILYFISCDLLYNFLTYNHPLWEYEPTLVYPNHTMMSLIAMFVAYPSVTLVFLGKYPAGRIKRILWICFWALLWTFLEWVSFKVGQFSYHNGWNLTWSIVFDFVLFAMLRLHFVKPLLTYVLSALITIGLLLLFDVSIAEMK
ncbi:hypothetical protein SD70_04750 [Gordoniibacillus kamchatkensis]|uniref:Uncharacterized protein n=1 Tax=Gordoniibacillus kamchatkensis TaxID=1590651 RepID=A0ABR5ALP3_9BACL|nr:CBO0543 family protein [Paenibacillus sp. VKM B-2647]KIL41919.1 hypothetical protein SD70_04750 [Paenibacillus sp. VKM B-2647]